MMIPWISLTADEALIWPIDRTADSVLFKLLDSNAEVLRNSVADIIIEQLQLAVLGIPSIGLRIVAIRTPIAAT